MTFDEKIRPEKLQYDVNIEPTEYQHYHQRKLRNRNILLVKRHYHHVKVVL